MKKSIMMLATAALAVTGIISGAAAAQADSGTTVNLSVAATADGSPGIVTGAGFSPASVLPGGATSMQMGTTTPANICRTTGTCAPGEPDNAAVLTITGLAQAGLTFVSNGDTSAGCLQVDTNTVICHYQYFNNYHKSDRFNFTVDASATPGSYQINVALHVFSKALPTTTTQCKDGGWSTFHDAMYAPLYKNQGDCVSFVATGGGTNSETNASL